MILYDNKDTRIIGDINWFLNSLILFLGIHAETYRDYMRLNTQNLVK